MNDDASYSATVLQPNALPRAPTIARTINAIAHSAELRSVGSPVPTHTISVSLGAIATAPIDCTGCLSKVESKVTPLSPVLNKPPVESPTKKIAGLRGSIAISETRRPSPPARLTAP